MLQCIKATITEILCKDIRKIVLIGGKYRKQESSEMECVQWLNMKALAPMGLLVSAYATESRVFVRRGRGCAKGRLLMIDC